MRDVMQTTVIIAEPEFESQLHLWSIADYHQMIEAGILTADDPVELLEGKIIRMSPQRPFHASCVQRSSNYFYEILRDRAYIRVQLPVTLGHDSEPEPDIAIVRFDVDEYAHKHPNAQDIYLLIEVADTTLSKDRKQKSRIYAKNSVLEYWILDLQKRQVFVFRRPENEVYQEELVIKNEQRIGLLAFPDIAIALEAIFPVGQIDS
jgi:Uma2 family endonuclease